MSEWSTRTSPDMLRLGRLPKAWVAPPAIRELRELVRHRAKLVQLRSGLKTRVHAVMASEGVLPQVSDLFGPAGNCQLDALDLGAPFAMRVASLRAHPEHRESDVKTCRGRISKQGSRLIRATLIERISRSHGGTHLEAQYRKIAKRRGRNQARIPLARKVLTLVSHGRRDGEIRSLAPIEETAA